MRQTNNEKEELNLLRKKGFTELTITRLYQLRRTYAQDEMDQAALDQRHLDFARWLVETGRLTDQIPHDNLSPTQEQERAMKRKSDEEKWKRFR